MEERICRNVKENTAQRCNTFAFAAFVQIEGEMYIPALRRNHMTDREIIALVRTSQEDGFRTLFQQYYRYVHTIVWGKLRFSGTAEDAEECISDVFLQVFLHFSEITEGSLQAYIGTVAKHKAIDYARKLGNAEAFTDDWTDLAAVASEEDIEQTVEDQQEHQLLYDCIRQLGEPDATIVILKYFYRLKAKDIAAQVRLTPVAVRVRLNRALKKLRQLYHNETSSA